MQPTPPGTTPAPRLLLVDDEPNILQALKRLLRSCGYTLLSAESGAQGLELLRQQPVDLVLSDMRMPGLSGAQFLQQVRALWPDTVRIMLTGHADQASILEAVNKGEIYRYITKPWDDGELLLVLRRALERRALEQEKQRLEALTQRQNAELKALNASLEAKVAERTAELQDANAQLKASFLTSIKVFSNLIEMRGGKLAGHTRRVADLARRIAVDMGLDGKQAQDIFVAGLLSEIGKVVLADEVMAQPIALMAPEVLRQYMNHVIWAEQLLLPLPDLGVVAHLIGAQLERYDGDGFPKGLRAEGIDLGARILTVASDYDNLQTGVLVNRRVNAEEARIFIVQGSGKRYDPQVVAALLRVLANANGATASEARRSREIESDALQDGMVLARDLLTPQGVLILSAEHVLNRHMIRKIREFERAAELQLRIPVLL